MRSGAMSFDEACVAVLGGRSPDEVAREIVECWGGHADRYVDVQMYRCAYERPVAPDAYRQVYLELAEHGETLADGLHEAVQRVKTRKAQ
jgi:hypothetical protein